MLGWVFIVQHSNLDVFIIYSEKEIGKRSGNVTAFPIANKFGATSVPLGATSVTPQNTILSTLWMFLTPKDVFKSISSATKILQVALETFWGVF